MPYSNPTDTLASLGMTPGLMALAEDTPVTNLATTIGASGSSTLNNNHADGTSIMEHARKRASADMLASTTDMKASRTLLREKLAKNANDDIQAYMNIHHFEQLMTIFKSHRNEEGEEGFDIVTFREVFGKVLGGNLSYDQMTQLFMKIDANSDGTVSWDEFSTFVVMVGGLDQEYVKSVVDEKVRKLVDSSHKDLIKRIDYVTKERKYVSISRDGCVCMWSPKLKLLRHYLLREGAQAWVTDCVLMQDQNKIAVISDDRQLSIFELISIKPRRLVTITPLDCNPLSIAYASKFDDERSVLAVGDDRGGISVLSFTKRFFVDYTSDTEPLVVKPAALAHREDGPFKGTIHLHRKKVHEDKEWVERIQCFREINAFVTCSAESSKSVIISDLERKTTRYINVPKGVRCFDYCRRPSFIITGGRDKIVRLWNPYVLSKAAGSLIGHNATITDVLVNQSEGHVISLSEDKVIKIWNLKSMLCIQTLTDRFPHRPENILSAIYFDNVHRQLLTGSSKVEAWPLYSQFKQSLVQSHEAPVVAAMFNPSFHQVVSGCEDSAVSVWDAHYGEKTFQFNQVHGPLEITAMCFDTSGRRLLTASRDGVIKVWNFNNGQLLRRCVKTNSDEVSALHCAEVGANKYILAVGWDHKISVFLDEPEPLECQPLREMSDAHRGHDEDILSIAFAPPNLVATGGLDGLIVAWNLESGTWRCRLKDPFLEYKSLESKAVEALHFIYDRTNTPSNGNSGSGGVGTSLSLSGNGGGGATTGTEYSRGHRFPLVSAHADGHVRMWDVYDVKMVGEMSAGFPDGEGLTSMSVNAAGTALVVGGSAGHIRVIKVGPISLKSGSMGGGGGAASAGSASSSDLSAKSVFKLGLSWKCHNAGITSVSFLSSKNAFLSSSQDATVRVWTLDGAHIGIFGQESMWDLDDPSTFLPIPQDVRQENLMERKREQLLDVQRGHLKVSVIDMWKSSKTGMIQQSSNQASFALQALSHPNFEFDDELMGAWANFKAFEASMDPKDGSAAQQLKELELEVTAMVNNRIARGPVQPGGGIDGALSKIKISQSNRVIAMQMHVVRKWREHMARKKIARDWRIQDGDLTVPHSTTHFRYSHAHSHPPSASRPTARIKTVKSETVYKELLRHTKYDIAEVRLPDKPNYGKDTMRAVLTNVFGGSSVSGPSGGGGLPTVLRNHDPDTNDLSFGSSATATTTATRHVTLPLALPVAHVLAGPSSTSPTPTPTTAATSSSNAGHNAAAAATTGGGSSAWPSLKRSIVGKH
ncbi:WD40-repeat-containing domain protein [Blastocladiella britannica]|nr:WD40-repeat-containing domain protein [Blastocladiella britannica]